MTAAQRTNPPAFPLGFIDTSSGTLPDGDEVVRHSGMTLRDYFAAHALQGLIANCYAPKLEDACSVAFGYADEMLKQREKQGQQIRSEKGAQ